MKRKISTKSTMATNNHNIETKGCTTMKRKLISILLTLVLCIGMLPSTVTTAYAATSASISLSSSSVSVKAGQSKTITASFTGDGVKNLGTGSTNDDVASVYISDSTYNTSTGKGTASITISAKSVGTTTIAFAIYNSSTMLCYKYINVTVTADTGTGLVGDGLYTISPACAPSCKLDVSGGSSNNKANLQIYTSNNTTSQQFYLTSMGNGYYIMTAKVSGKVVTAASSKSTANVYQYEYNRGTTELWLIKSAGDGYYYIYSGADTSKALDVSGGVSTSGTNVQLYTANKTDAQKWALNRVSSSTSGSTVSSVKSTTNSTAASYNVKVTNTSSSSYVTIDILTLSNRYKVTSSGTVNVKIVSPSGKVLVSKTCSSSSNKITVPKGYSSYTVYVTKYTWSGNNLITSSIAGGNNFTNLGNYCQISLSNAKLT